MEGEGVKLLGALQSPFVLRVAIALNIKGVGYEFLEETLGSKSELLLKCNPIYKKQPVLIHGGKPICESMIIVQYVDQVWATTGPSVLPSDPFDRALARFWAVYIDDKLWPSLLGILKAKTEDEKTAAEEQAVAILQLLEEAFGKCSNGKHFFGGDTIGYLDIALGSFFGWIKAVEEFGSGSKLLNEEKTPQLVRWGERFRLHDAVKDVLLGTHKFVERGKKLRVMWNIVETTK